MWGRLEQILEDIKKVGKDQPAQAFDLVWYFIDEIPNIFNSVHDECELEEFCTALLEAALELGRKSGASMEEVGTRLIDAYLSDADDTCRFDDALDLLLKARLSAAVRETIARYAEKKAADQVSRGEDSLLEFVRNLRRSERRRHGLRSKTPNA